MKKRPLPPHIKLFSDKATKVFKGVRFDTYQWQQMQFDGSTATYEVVKRNDTVIIIPVIGDEIVMVRERQPHWEKDGYTLVAGMVNENEDLEAAARRELEEETGLVFKDYHLVHVEANTPGIEWFAYVFIASNYQGKKKKNLDPGEKNKTVKVSFDRLIAMTRKVELYYRPRFIEYMLMQDKERELKKLLKNPGGYSL